jgi:hypothetical protein
MCSLLVRPPLRPPRRCRSSSGMCHRRLRGGCGCHSVGCRNAGGCAASRSPTQSRSPSSWTRTSSMPVCREKLHGSWICNVSRTTLATLLSMSSDGPRQPTSGELADSFYAAPLSRQRIRRWIVELFRLFAVSREAILKTKGRVVGLRDETRALLEHPPPRRRLEFLHHGVPLGIAPADANLNFKHVPRHDRLDPDRATRADAGAAAGPLPRQRLRLQGGVRARHRVRPHRARADGDTLRCVMSNR